MSVNNYDVLKVLGEQNCKSYKGFFGDNITGASIGKNGWGRVTVAIDNETARKIMTRNPEVIFLLVVADRDDFLRAKADLEREG